MSKISTKNILKKIFKAKSKKKVKKKVTVKKVSKTKKEIKNKTKKAKKFVAKKTKKISKKITPKSIKAKKVAGPKEEIKADNLRISKSNEVKPEIKKVKKQETEKREYKIKDYVVYPKHGVGQITEFKKINIGEIDVETYVIKFYNICFNINSTDIDFFKFSNLAYSMFWINNIVLDLILPFFSFLFFDFFYFRLYLVTFRNS